MRPAGERIGGYISSFSNTFGEGRISKEVAVKASWTLMCLLLIGFGGCAGRGERIDVAIPGSWAVPAASASTGPRIAVLPFDDQRATQVHLGQREHLWGGQSYFDLPGDSVSRATALAVVDYLNRRGWRTSLAHTPAVDGADVTIMGTLSDLSIHAKSGFMHTDLSAKSSVAFEIKNHSDNTLVRERVSGSATDQVFWFNQEDARTLLNELLERNLQKFVSDVRIDERTIRLR